MPRAVFGLPRAAGGLGSIATISWGPYRYQALAAKQWDSEFSAADEVMPGPPPPRDRPRPPPPPPRNAPNLVAPVERVAEIVDLFKAHYEAAGLRRAADFGPLYVIGAQLYVSMRAASEEDLAARVAELNAEFVRTRALGPLIRRLFLEERLTEVRAAVRQAETPPQAVRDRPEIPTQRKWRVPAMVSYLALGMSAFSLAIAVFRQRGGR